MERMSTFAVLLALTLWPAAQTFAQEPECETLFQNGVALAADGKFEAALTTWGRVEPDCLAGDLEALLQYYLGVAHKSVGHWPQAWHHLGKYLTVEEAPQPDAAEHLAQVEAALCKSGFAMRIVACESDGVQLVEQSSGAVHQCPLVWWFPEGVHTLVARKAGCEDAQVLVDATETGKREYVAEPTCAAPVGGAVAAAAGPSDVWKWALLGGGLALVATGGTLQYMAHTTNEGLRAQFPTFPEGCINKKLYNDAYNKEVVPLKITAWAMYGVGGATAIAGVIWLALDEKNKAVESSAWHIAPQLLSDGAAVSFDWRF